MASEMATKPQPSQEESSPAKVMQRNSEHHDFSPIAAILNLL